MAMGCVILLLCVTLRGQAQSPAPTPAPSQAPSPELTASEPSLKTNPMDVLRSFEPAADEQYRLGNGDEITLDFAGRPEMQAKLVVGPDGRISLPLAGEIMLGGLTRPEAALAIENALKSYYADLSAHVSVTRYTANRVLLLGAVEHPGTIIFDGTPTLLETLSRGGVETGAGHVSQVPERCAVYRGHDQVVWVELKALVESGNALADLRLRRGDIVYVPSASERVVSVLGEVQHPGAIPITHNSSIASVLASAGGLTDKAGMNAHIQITDPATGTSRVIRMHDVLDPAKSLEIALQPGQIVYVTQSGLSHVGVVLQKLSPLMTVATMAIVEATRW